MNVANSSWSNCVSVNRGPCSRTTTENPAVESSFAMMPPAAPDPTMAKSTVSLGEKRARWASCTSCPPVHFGVVLAKRRLESRLMFEPEHVPAGIVAIAAPCRQRKGADDGVEACGLKERRLLDLAKQFVLLRGRQLRKGPAFLPLVRRAPIEVPYAVGVQLLLAR